jgi:NitT/TauT family transport system substrate-binding protein
MSEPLQARHAGVAVKVFPVSDIGYNPYTTVLATSGKLIDQAAQMVAAVREGWRSYLDDSKPTNDRMHALNPGMDLATFTEVADAQKPFIETNAGLGTMTAQRWEDLIAQLKDVGNIPQIIPAQDCFRSL